MSAFEYGTGLLGSTRPGQRVTVKNINDLPCGSVVRNGDGTIIIRLHNDLWYWRSNCSWLYDNVARMRERLDEHSVACHVGPISVPSCGGSGVSEETKQTSK